MRPHLVCHGHNTTINSLAVSGHDWSHQALLTSPVEQWWTNLCTYFTNVLSPYQTYPLPDSLQDEFATWTDYYMVQQASKKTLDRVSYRCYYPEEQQCSDEWFMYITPRRKLPLTLTYGCNKYTMMMDPPCLGLIDDPGYSLVGGTITSTYAVMCGAKHISQMIITTDIEPTPTSPSVDTAVTTEVAKAAAAAVAASSAASIASSTAAIPAVTSSCPQVTTIVTYTTATEWSTTFLTKRAMKSGSMSPAVVDAYDPKVEVRAATDQCNPAQTVLVTSTLTIVAVTASQLLIKTPSSTTSTQETVYSTAAVEISQLQIATPSPSRYSDSESSVTYSSSNNEFIPVVSPPVSSTIEYSSSESQSAEPYSSTRIVGSSVYTGSQLLISTSDSTYTSSTPTSFSDLFSLFSTPASSKPSVPGPSSYSSYFASNKHSITYSVIQTKNTPIYVFGSASYVLENDPVSNETVASTTEKTPSSTTFPSTSITKTTSISKTTTFSKTSTALKGDPTIAFSLAKNEVLVQKPFTKWTYFVAMYLPALIAVVIKAMWEIIATSLKLLEPFERLLDGNGVTAKYSILTQYLEGIITLDLFRALSHGRLVPLCSALTFIMVEIAPLIASVSMSVRARHMCLDIDEYRPCDPAWVINEPLVRVLEGFMIGCVLLVICLIWLTRRSSIPVATNPSSIASVAALLNYDPLIRELQKVDPDANGVVFSKALKNKRFHMVTHYDPKLEQERFGFVVSRAKRSDHDEGKNSWLPFTDTGRDDTASYVPVGSLSRSNTRRKNLSNGIQVKRYASMWMIFFFHFLTTATLLSIIMAYWFDQDLDDVYNRFWNADSVPAIVPKILLVGLAVVVDIQMKYLDRIVRITDPFRRMALRNARAETTILLPLNGTCWSNLPRNIYLLARYEFAQGRMWWVTIVSFVACLSEVNILACAGLLWNLAQTTEAYHASGYMSMACTSAILVVVLITTIWWLNVPVVRRMPRQPDNIGHILSYLCGSEMIMDWNSISTSAVPIEDLPVRQRDALVRQSGRRFCFGRMLGVDNRERWCIDYERDQGQVMVVNEENAGNMSAYPQSANWGAPLPKIKRKPLSTTSRVQDGDHRWETALMTGTREA